jgi:hypothetical protein
LYGDLFVHMHLDCDASPLEHPKNLADKCFF